MKGLAFWFMVLGVISVLVGMGWGIHMASSGDHVMMPAHAHLNLMGFVSFAIFAFYYHMIPGADAGTLPKLHFVLSLLGLVIVVPGIALSIMQRTDALAAAGSVISTLGMLCFLVVVLRGAHAR